MKALSRFVGLILAASAFVAFIVDSARSIASDALNPTPAGAVWASISLSSLDSVRVALTEHVSPFLWNPVLFSLLRLPFFVILIALSALFLWAGRRPREEIGYATRT